MMVKRVAKFKQSLLQNCPVYQVKPEIVIYCVPSESCSKGLFSVGALVFLKLHLQSLQAISAVVCISSDHMLCIFER